MTHAEKVLQLLSDGKPHSHLEGYRLGVMLHSRVADLRKKGHVIECWREGDHYLYQLDVSAELARMLSPLRELDSSGAEPGSRSGADGLPRENGGRDREQAHASLGAPLHSPLRAGDVSPEGSPAPPEVHPDQLSFGEAA